MPQAIEQLNKELAEARALLRRKQHHEQVLARTEQQVASAEAALQLAEERAAGEQKDVDQLERVSFKALWAAVIGAREERLDIERAEAAAAQIRVEQERARVRRLIQDRASLEAAGAEFEAAEERFRELLADKERAVLMLGLPAGGELEAIADQAAGLSAERRELKEACDAGRRALEWVDEVGRLLGSAGAASGWDLIGGGELVSQFKYDKLDSAGRAVAYAQWALDAFSRELVDVGVEQRHRVPAIPNNWLTDVLFDNIFTDAVRNGQIRNATEQFRSIRDAVQTTIRSLGERDAEAERSLVRLQTRKETLLVGD
ncbi:hypothetical protein [Glycomyces tritici]|uniref:Uncharacterized protein n=1 Tax=Glycomyces tritici TaxID=2665176 RepID=A0ABT7YWU6_9ACTN|nr:hypothetical protein [Glycomyces tritici]MDN3243114.1 hypothetical protein [Glycomyces tritici]